MCSARRLGGGSNGGSLGCRGHRLCGSGLPRDERRSASGHRGLPSCTNCTRLHKERSSWRDIRSDTRTRTLRAPALSIERVFFTHLRMTEERGKGWGGGGGGVQGLMGDAGRRSVQHCIQLVGQVVKHAADVVQDGHGRLLTGKRKSHNGPSLAFSRTLSSSHPFSRRQVLSRGLDCRESRKSSVFI